MSGFWTQFTYLFSRASKNAFRNPLIVRAKFGQTLFISLLIGWLYVNTDSKTGFVAVQNRTGVLFFLVCFGSCGAYLNSLNTHAFVG